MQIIRVRKGTAKRTSKVIAAQSDNMTFGSSYGRNGDLFFSLSTQGSGEHYTVEFTQKEAETISRLYRERTKGVLKL